MFNESKCAASIALNQCFLSSYALCEIDRTGITGELITDNVAELIAPSVYWTSEVH